MSLMLRLARQALLVSILCLLATLFTPGTEAASSALERSLAGTVLDSHRQPIWGATVTLRGSGLSITSVPTDSAGRFTVRVPDSLNSDSLLVSAVGFERALVDIASVGNRKSLVVTLTESTIDFGRINVRAHRERRVNNHEFSSDQIREASAGSLVPGNPTAALATPQLARVGSNHSSQIRISGAAPTFYLNGAPIGADPNHFGAFSVVPGTIVQSMRFLPQGTDASFGTASAVDFKTVTPFDTRLSGSLNLSTIEADAFFRIGNRRFFALGSLRKSTLDKLVRQFDINSDRRTVPPTNFQDIFASVGVRLSANSQLLVDQYSVRDFLSYNTASAGHDLPSTQTVQASRENYLGAKLQRVSTRLHLQASVAINNSVRQYVAVPQGESTVAEAGSSSTTPVRQSSDVPKRTWTLAIRVSAPASNGPPIQDATCTSTSRTGTSSPVRLHRQPIHLSDRAESTLWRLLWQLPAEPLRGLRLSRTRFRPALLGKRPAPRTAFRRHRRSESPAETSAVGQNVRLIRTAPSLWRLC